MYGRSGFTFSRLLRHNSRRDTLDAMHLTPREIDKLLIFSAGELARKRRARGLKLNHPEAVALITSDILELIRDGRSVAEIMSIGPTILAGPIFFPGDQATQILRGYREYTATLPDAMTTLVNLATAPPAPFLPADVHGKKIVTVVGVYAGSRDEGQKLAAPLRQLGTPITDLLGPMPYAMMQSLLDGLYTPGARNYFKAGYLGGLSDEAIETLVRFHGPSISPSSEIHIHHLGGAVARVPDGATAFGQRGAPYLLNIVARWTDPGTDDAQIAWARDLYAAAEPFSTGGTYVNFLSAGDDRVAAAYGQDKYERLARLKETWDPTNVFRLNQNIRPAGSVDA